MTEPTNLPAESGGGKPLSKQAMFSKVSAHGNEIIEFLLNTMRNPAIQHSVRLSAANKLIDKVLPDLKAEEHSFDQNGPIRITIVEAKDPAQEATREATDETQDVQD